MWEHIIAAAAAIVVALIEGIAAKERRERKKESEELIKRADIRKEESRLSMKMMSAALQLSVVTANALTGGHNNGNVERAKHAAEEAEKEYQAFLQRITSEELNK